MGAGTHSFDKDGWIEEFILNVEPTGDGVGDRGYASLGCDKARLSRGFGSDGAEMRGRRAAKPDLADPALSLFFRGHESAERLAKSGGGGGKS